MVVATFLFFLLLVVLYILVAEASHLLIMQLDSLLQGVVHQLGLSHISELSIGLFVKSLS